MRLVDITVGSTTFCTEGCAICPTPSERTQLLPSPYNTRVNRVPRFCYAGTYERGYPRNRLTAQALRDVGVHVEEAHVPVWERVNDKSGVGPRQLTRIAIGLLLAYGRLVPEIALRLLRCDVLVIGYIGQMDMLILAPVAKLMGKPVVFDPLVTLTDTIVEDRGLLAPTSPFARLIALVDQIALRLADAVLTDTAENSRYLQDRFGVSASAITVVPVGADEAMFFPASDADWRDATEERPLDVLFYGKFIPLHGIATIIRAAAIVAARGVAVRFELIGTGQTYHEMRGLAETLKVPNITWTDWLDEPALGDRLRRTDVALGVFSGGTKAGRVVPNKVYQSLASGVATVTRLRPCPNCDPEDSGPTNGFGAGVAPSDPIALADMIEKLCSGSLREQVANDGRIVYNNQANAEVRAQLAGDVVAAVMGSRWRRRPVRG